MAGLREGGRGMGCGTCLLWGEGGCRGGGTRGENGVSVERKVHLMPVWSRSALQGTPVLPGDPEVPAEPQKAG